MNYWDKRSLQKHMKTCDSCRSVYESISKENLQIRQAILQSDAPSSILIDTMKSIDSQKYKHKKISNSIKYLSYAAVIVLLITSMYYGTLYLRNGKTIGETIKSDEISDIKNSKELVSILKQYIKENVLKSSDGSEAFTALDIFDIRKSSDTHGEYQVYLWCYVKRYSWNKGLVDCGSVSEPMVVYIKKEGSSYKPVLYHTENTADIDTLLNDFKDEIAQKKYDPLYADELEQQVKKEAFEYFKKYNLSTPMTEFQKSAKSFIEKYGWTSQDIETVVRVKIPSSFDDKPGEYPIGLYWAYANVLSKDAGLDMAGFKGIEVNAHLVPLVDMFGYTSYKDTRAVIIEKNNKIIGAWIDKGPGGGPWVSMNKNYFDTITGKSWGQWLTDQEIENNINGFESGINGLSPEQVIKKYYDALNKKDQKTAFSLFSKASQFQETFVNGDNSKLCNEGFITDGEETLSAKLIKIEPYSTFNPDVFKTNNKDQIKSRQIYDAKEFMVTLDMNFKLQMFSGNGVQQRFVIMVKETANSPWKVECICTGP